MLALLQWPIFRSSLYQQPSILLNSLLHPISRRCLHNNSALPNPPSLATLDNPKDTATALTWISRFERHTIAKGQVEMSFSRSSGPGGQNVNKVNTKATLRCPLDAPWIPMWAREELMKSPHYVSSTKSILITSTVFRSQAQNVTDCLSKLHKLILHAAYAPVKKEPSEQQQRRVAALVKADSAARRAYKSHRSAVKEGRSNRSRFWD